MLITNLKKAQADFQMEIGLSYVFKINNRPICEGRYLN